jgi:hypothetical protein
MAKVVVAKREKKAAKRASKAVASKRVRDSKGQFKFIHELDFGSETFGRDLEYVFSKNVTKARRENKRIVGSPDFDVAKR